MKDSQCYILPFIDVTAFIPSPVKLFRHLHSKYPSIILAFMIGDTFIDMVTISTQSILFGTISSIAITITCICELIVSIGARGLTIIILHTAHSSISLSSEILPLHVQV